MRCPRRGTEGSNPSPSSGESRANLNRAPLRNSAAPYSLSALIRLNFCLACQRESEPMSTSRTAPRITICGIPELGEYSAAGVTHILSILGPNLPDPPEFAAFAPHRRLILALSPRRPFTIG